MEPFIGQIMMFGGNFAPRGWALCDGSLLSISQNQALFSILGTTYGGDGRTTFGLPDLRGRVPMHPGSGPGLTTRTLGQKSGTETNTLTESQLPSHTHTASGTVSPQCKNGSGDDSNPKDAYPAGATTDHVCRNSQSNDGRIYPYLLPSVIRCGGQSVNNIQPFQCVNFIIALVGTYPSRN